jgi:hypothetical protein
MIDLATLLTMIKRAKYLNDRISGMQYAVSEATMNDKGDAIYLDLVDVETMASVRSVIDKVSVFTRTFDIVE